MSKNLHLISLGCTKNLVDSEVMLGTLSSYSVVEDIQSADVVIVNTCGFIDSAKQESISTILQASNMRKDGALLVVSGCLSERYRDELLQEIPEIDIITGVGDYDKIDKMIENKSKQKSYFSPKIYLQSQDTKRVISNSRLHAYIKLSEGCNQACSFCSIPSFKGALHSRSVDSVIKEMAYLIESGFMDFSFVAQDSSSYMRDIDAKYNHGSGLKELIQRIDEAFKGTNITARILYLYPSSTSVDLIEMMGDSRIIVPYFDMPIQHISNAMLKRMRRGSDKSTHIKLLKSMRQIKNSFVRTTLILGHPDESEEEFGELVSFMDDFSFDRVNIFEYSSQDGTLSDQMIKNGKWQKIDKKIINKRINTINKILKRQNIERNKILLNTHLDVYVERKSEVSEYFYSARDISWAPDIDGEILINHIDERLENSDIHGRYRCQITEIKDGYIFGSLV